MISTAARAFERLFGGVLVPAAGTLRVIAWIALAALLLQSIAQAIRALAASRHGWETATVVRCRECGLLAADATVPRCANGHELRFPPGAAGAQERRRQRAIGMRGSLPLAFVAALVAAGAAVLAAHSFRLGEIQAPPVAAAADAAGFLFFAVAAAGWLRAGSPTARSPLDRAISLLATVAAIIPALLFLSLARAADPLPPRAIGSLWTTPSALYVSAGGRAKRVEGAAPSALEAELVEARFPIVATSWMGLARLSSGGHEFPWRGSGGMRARIASHLPHDSLSPLLVVERTHVSIATPPNTRIWILRVSGGITFETDRGAHPPFDAGEPRR